MGTAVRRVDVVGEGEDEVVIAVVVLQGNFGEGIAVHAGHIDDILRQGFQPTLFLEILHELADTALVVQDLGVRLCLVSLVGKDDADAGIQERLLPQTLEEYLEVVFCSLGEDLRICLEFHGSTGFGRVADDRNGLVVIATVELLKIHVGAVLHGELQPLREGVDHRCAHAVQTAGHLVSAAAELTAGVQDGVHYGCCGDALLGVDAHRNATAVIGDPHHVFRQDVHGDLRAVAGKCLINGVIDDLIDQMVQPLGTCGADVHARTLPDCLQPLQHLNLTLVIALCALFHFFCHMFYPSCQRSCIPLTLPETGVCVIQSSCS